MTNSQCGSRSAICKGIAERSSIREREVSSLKVVGIDYWTDFGKRLNEHLGPFEGARVLDIGTGRGACLFPAANIIGSEGEIIGIDLRENAISEVKAKIQNLGLTNASVQIMNANEMSFTDNSFDFILSGFIGFNDVFDFKTQNYRKENKKMSEMLRILKKGGKIGFTTWLLQEDLEWLGTLIEEYLMQNLGIKNHAEIVNVPTSYSKESVEGFRKIMLDAGFQNVDVFVEEFKIRYQDEEEWWDMMLRVGEIPRRIMGSDGTKLLDFKKQMFRRGLQDFKLDNGLYFTKAVIFAFGTK
ncbi:MAG: class I SAM-dependent methyltransferase [Candidatus Odinarchaeota archaeon]